MRRLIALGASMMALLAIAGPAHAAVTATVSPTVARPGGAETVTGSGFDANAAVDVYWGTTEIGLATSSATGAVSTTVSLPTSAQPGVGWLTLDEEGSHRAAQSSLTVTTNWVQGGFGPSGRGFNPYEDTLTNGNVSQLATAWSQPVTIYVNAKGLIVVNNYVYVLDEDDGIHVYSLSGKLTWTETLGTAFSYSALTPAAAGTLVYFAGPNGVVSAYSDLCRTDGGKCTPAWTKNIGTAAVGGITVRNGFLYVPGADGVIHVLSATNGAVGTSLTVYSFTPGAALTSAVSFDDSGDYYVAQGSNMDYSVPAFNDSGFDSFAAGTELSDPVAGNDAAYFTTSTGYVSSIGGGWTGVPLYDSTPCDPSPAPVVANSVVYVQGCGTLGAYDANTGEQQWSIATAQDPLGISYADGVLYACIYGRLDAYDAGDYGEKLWSGGPCSTAPVVVNGVVLDTGGDLYAATLTGALTTSMRHVTPRRPDPRTLRPTLRRHHRVRSRQTR